MNITESELNEVIRLDELRKEEPKSSRQFKEAEKYYHQLMNKYGFHPLSYIQFPEGEIIPYDKNQESEFLRAQRITKISFRLIKLLKILSISILSILIVFVLKKVIGY